MIPLPLLRAIVTSLRLSNCVRTELRRIETRYIAIAKPTIARKKAIARGYAEGPGSAVSPRCNFLTKRACRHPAKTFTNIPTAISAVPNHNDNPEECAVGAC